MPVLMDLQMHKAACRAIDLLGGPSAAARKLSLSRRQNVEYWRRAGVPKELAPSVESECRGLITVEEMCPHVKWVRVKDASWPHRSGRPCADFSAVPA